MFKDLNDFLDDTLVLPIKGKKYTVQAPDGETGLLCQRLLALGAQAAKGEAEVKSTLDDDDEEDLYQRVLGPVWDEMMADKVSWPRIKRASTTVMFWCTLGLAAAEAYWNSEPDGPKAPPKQPTDRKPGAKSARPASTDTRRQRTAAKKTATAGRTSSTTGAS